MKALFFDDKKNLCGEFVAREFYKQTKYPDGSLCYIAKREDGQESVYKHAIFLHDLQCPKCKSNEHLVFRGDEAKKVSSDYVGACLQCEEDFYLFELQNHNCVVGLESITHNFNIDDAVTVTDSRDSYEEEDMETEMRKHEGRKLIIRSIIVIDQQLVHYLCVDTNNNWIMFDDERLRFIDADLKPYSEVMKTFKFVESVSTGKVELDVYECQCGFHLGIDATYLDQVSEVSIPCPSCGKLFKTQEDDGLDTDLLDTEDKCFNANDYSTRELLEMEFQNVPNGTQKENLIAEALQLVEECAYTVGEAANEVRVSAKEKTPKLMFTTVSEGLEKIKEEYRNGEVVEGEFADYLVLYCDEYFDASIDPTIAMRAIQEFRQWDYQMEGDDAIETFGGVEAFSENGYYGFIFMRNGQSMQLPDGVRIGIEQEDGGIALDEGITACFSKEETSLTPRYCIVLNTEEDGSSTLNDYDNLDSAMEAYNHIKEFGRILLDENSQEDNELPDGSTISMDIEWWNLSQNFLEKNEAIDVPSLVFRRVLCDCCESAYMDFVLTEDKAKDLPLYLCTMCRDNIVEDNEAVERGEEPEREPRHTLNELAEIEKTFNAFEEENKSVDCGNL